MATISTLKTFLAKIEDLALADSTLFRGQRDDWDLLPKIARINPRYSALDDEKQMVASLRRQVRQFINHEPRNDCDLLALPQHHGMATRLLDWTRNPLAALFFAVAEPARKKTNAVVWFFQPEEADFVADFETIYPFSMGGTRIFVPNTVTAGIRVQSGFFSVHSRSWKLDRFVPLQRNRLMKSKLHKIEIAPRHFSDLRYMLDQCGINRASFFPDLDGLCQYLTWSHSKLEDEP